MVGYVPHKSRKEPPFQEDVLVWIDDCIAENKRSGDAIIVMGDMNCRLKRGEKGYTGKWCVHF